MQACPNRLPAICRRALEFLCVLAFTGGLLIGFPCSPVWADDTGVGSDGGGVYPLENTDIRMEAETVQAICFRDFVEYRVDFQFNNYGKTQTVKLGFPFVLTKSDYKGQAPGGFRAWQDGRPLTISIGRSVSGQDFDKSPPPELGYFLHEATFPPGETMITVSYLAWPSVTAGAYYGELAPKQFTDAGIGGFLASYSYWLHTGATWRDTIGKAVVRYSLADSFAGWAVDAPPEYPDSLPDLATGPAPFTKVGDRAYQWVFENLEPTEKDDVRLVFSQPNVPWDADRDLPAGLGAYTYAESASAGTLATEGASGQSADDDSVSVWTGLRFPAPSVGGWIRYSIKGNQSLQEFRILPGRIDSLTSFREYGRPRTVRVTLSNGTHMDFPLKDEPEMQCFPLRGIATEATVEILDIYPGAKSNDTYIAYIEFGNQPAPTFAPFSTLIEEKAAVPTTVTSAVATSTTTGQATVAMWPSTTVVAGLSTPAPTSTGPSNAPAEHLRWPAWLGLGVAILGLSVVVLLLLRLRRKTV